MNRYILDEFHDDPLHRLRVEQAAHRERSRALRAGIAWLVSRVRESLAPRGRWIERLG